MTEMRKSKKTFAIIFLVALCSGCPVGPNYKRPPVPAPPEYRGASPDQAGKAEAASFATQKWWDVFPDETLRDLIHAALEQNHDVRIAAERILEARAQLGITRADQ